MQCYKLKLWFDIDYPCMINPYGLKDCDAYWVTLYYGIGIKVCFDCYFYLVKTGLTEERRSDEQEKETKKAQEKGS